MDSEDRKSLDPETSGSGSFTHEIKLERVQDGANTTRNVEIVEKSGSGSTGSNGLSRVRTTKKLGNRL